MKTIRVLSIATFLLLTACVGAIKHPTPSWTLDPPQLSSEGLYVMGVGYPSPNERSARESALESALTEFLRYTGVEVSSYVKMTSRETAEENQAGRIAMDNTENITLATQGFVQKVRQVEWSIDKNTIGQTVAYVRILVPAAEVARVEGEQKAMRQAKRAPYEAAATSSLRRCAIIV